MLRPFTYHLFKSCFVAIVTLVTIFLIGFIAPRIAFGDVITIAYGKHTQQKLDVYPAAGNESSGGTPVVIWVHGGGWRAGDKDNRSGKNLCHTWAQTGITMVNLNYRLTPDVTHPAHVEDIASGIAWVHKNISEHGGDPKRVFLLGHSAGAHLVALVATAPEYLQAHQLHLKDTIAGVMAIDTASYDLRKTETPMVRKMIRDAFGEDLQLLAQASPLVQAKKNADQCPPFIIATVKQRPESVLESSDLSKLLPGSRLLVQDYPKLGQLKAHGQIAQDLLDTQNTMTEQLLRFIKQSPSR